MAKLSGPLGFTGKLTDISAYKMKGFEGTVLRMGWGPSKKDIDTKDSYAITRKNNAEFGGRSRAGAFIKAMLRPLAQVLDYNMCPVLTGLLRPVQEGDQESQLGYRNVLLSKRGFLLEGLNLNRRHPFDGVISSPFRFDLDKAAGKAQVTIPELMPSVNFFPPANFSVCRITALLGFLPDHYYAEPLYEPLEDYSQRQPNTASSEWFLASKGCSSSELNLSLSFKLPAEGFSLMIAVALEVGTPTPTGQVVPLRYNGCGKILTVR